MDARDLAVLGIGCGGPLDTELGIVHNPPNLPGWDAVPVAARMRTEFGLPVRLENDAVAAGLGEYTYGAGRGAHLMVYVTVSTGVGGAVILNGQPLRGRNGNGGELGHMIIIHDGRPCQCGSYGCLEAYVSGTSIAARAREALQGGASSVLAGGEVSAADVASAAANGDQLAVALWDETTALLGTGIANLINLFEPEIVVLGGGVAQAKEQLLQPVRRRALDLALSFNDNRSDVALSDLADKVGVVGAAAAAFVAIREEASRV